MMINQRFKIGFVVLFMMQAAFWGGLCYGQNRQSTEIELLFRVGSSEIPPDYQTNQEALRRLEELLTGKESQAVESIHILGAASPDGSMAINQRLSSERAAAVRRYIQERFPAISSEQISAVGKGENWAGLRKLVDEDLNTPNRNRILDIIDNVPAPINYKTNTSRKKSVMDLGVVTWRYLYRNMFPQLRSVVSIVVTVINEPDKPAESVADPVEVIAEKPAESVADPVEVITFGVIEPSEAPIVQDGDQTTVLKPLFALKTNLLFDVASMLNIEIEVPLGKRWSIAGEYIFPWWLWESKQYCLQMLSGNIEGRYWFGNRDTRPLLTGWFAGLYAGGGYYDLGFGNKGYQGEFFIASGISGGYAHTINKKGSLRMEYSLGVGYMQTQYREYVPKYGVDDQWHLIRQQNGTFSWLGPTRAKVSLVWMLNYKKKGGSK